MTWPFLYFPGDRLTRSELIGARLDGDLVELGEAFLPADAVETRELRAASLRPLVSGSLALTRESAAWVHGGLDSAPPRHSVQRIGARRLPHVLHPRLAYHDQRLAPGAAMLLGGVWVTSPAYTLAELVRAACAGTDVAGALHGLLRALPGLAAEALAALESGPPVPFKRAARVWLRARLSPQDEVTRYTS
ncbi:MULTISPECIES: SAM-dependent methyltransferase [unclassified Microbacterium]|uniref:SAM-dependent methyltransferase n=1 Tax=unclassified Microbacterium TaxID=2609290 RepID=UPI003016F4BE